MRTKRSRSNPRFEGIYERPDGGMVLQFREPYTDVRIDWGQALKLQQVLNKTIADAVERTLKGGM